MEVSGASDRLPGGILLSQQGLRRCVKAARLSGGQNKKFSLVEKTGEFRISFIV
jgi:hypothetical protein